MQASTAVHDVSFFRDHDFKVSYESVIAYGHAVETELRLFMQTLMLLLLVSAAQSCGMHGRMRVES